MTELDPAERFIWFGFLLLAGDSPYEGQISITEEIGYTDDQLGSLLKCDPKIIRSAKKKMVKYEKISIDDRGIIQILNWYKYQSEYSRQKKYRSPDGQLFLRKEDEKLQTEVTADSDTIEREREIERDIEKKEEKEKNEFFENEFEIFWKFYHPDGKKNKVYSKKRFLALCKKGEFENFKKGFYGYANYLEFKNKKQNFNQAPKYFSTLCTDYGEYIKYYGQRQKPDL